MVDGQLNSGIELVGTAVASTGGITICSWNVPENTCNRVEVYCILQRTTLSTRSTYKLIATVAKQDGYIDGYAQLVGDIVKIEEEGTTSGYEVTLDVNEGYLNVITASPDGNEYRVTCYVKVFSVEQFIDEYSLLFDGSDEYVTMGNVLPFERTDSFSLSFWMKTSSAANDKGILCKEDGSFRGYEITIYDGHIIYAIISTLFTSWIKVGISDMAYNDGVWRHYVLTYDGSSAASGVKGYVNGVTKSLTTYEDNLTTTIANTGSLVMAARTTSSSFNNVMLTDISIYNKELSLSESQAIYNNGVPTNIKNLSSASNIVGYWRCGDGDTYPTILDHSSDFQFPIIPDETANSYNGTATNMEVSDIQFASPGSQALVFGGGNEYVTMGNVSGFERTDTISFSCWFKTTTTASESELFSKALGSGTWQGYDLAIVNTGALEFDIISNWSTGNRLRVRTTTTGYNNGMWHHAVVTYSGSSAASGVLIYVDGSLVTTSVTYDSLTGSIVATSSFNIGAVNNGTYPFIGSISDVSVWDKKLSITEVLEIYNNKVPINLTTVSCAANLAAWWRCGEKYSLTSNGVPDFSGNGYHGTQQNMEITDVEDRAYMGNSMLFDGFDEYVIMDDILKFEKTDPFSVSYWIRTTDTSVYIFTKMEYTTDLIGYGNSIDSSGHPYFLLLNLPSAQRLDVRATNSVNNGNWHHVIISYDGSVDPSGVKFYIDGSSDTAVTAFDTLTTASIQTDLNFIIACRNEVSSFYNGELYNMAFYDKELSLSEVQTIYNNGIPTDLTGSANLVGYWKMGDEVGFNGTMTNMETADITNDTPPD